jgi:hypothetical protein
MEAVDTEVDGGAFTGLDDFVFDLFSDFGDDFFDSSGVDATVGDELVESQTGDFAAHGVKA